MDINNALRSKYLKNKNKETILELALTLNKELFDENKISYKMFKSTEEGILKQIKGLNLSNSNINS